ncbi:MAG: hypothetical protein K2N65_05570 [Anaeroplasmataceae bacterium]|nr:hypothetical protein [Anaeroplasmataceae bacterium]
MKNVTKKHFRNLFIFYFIILALSLTLMIISIGIGEFIFSIPWIMISVEMLIFIGIHFGRYLKYKHNTNILVGTITNVISFKSYQIVINCEDKNYYAAYKFISSHIRDKVGCKCTFVENGKGKAYIKDIE